MTFIVDPEMEIGLRDFVTVDQGPDTIARRREEARATHLPRAPLAGVTVEELWITPDGPRGPRRRLAQGPIYLASRLNLPLIALGFGYNRPWRVRSWDRFAIPKPYSRARGLVSPPMQIPPDLDRAGIETCRLRVEKLLNCLNVEAETWAESGHRIAGEVHVHPQAALLRSGSKMTEPAAATTFCLPKASKAVQARVA
mgnify:CR=1 FL=1